MGSGVKSYMRKVFLIYEKMRKYFIFLFYFLFFMSASDLQGLVSVETYLRTVRQAIGRMFDLKKMSFAEELRRILAFST